MKKVCSFLFCLALFLSVHAQDDPPYQHCGTPDMDTTEFYQLP